MDAIEEIKKVLFENGFTYIRAEERAGKTYLIHDRALPRGTIELLIADEVAKEYGIEIGLMDQGNPYRNEMRAVLSSMEEIDVLTFVQALSSARERFDRDLRVLAETVHKRGKRERCEQSPA